MRGRFFYPSLLTGRYLSACYWTCSLKTNECAVVPRCGSNGNGTPQVLEYLRPWVDLYKVELKSFDDRHYRQLGGRLQPILDTIRRLHEMGFWLEIVERVEF